MYGSLVHSLVLMGNTGLICAVLGVNMGGVIVRPIAQNLKYYISIVTSGREQLSRQAIELSEVLAQQLSERVAHVVSYAK